GQPLLAPRDDNLIADVATNVQSDVEPVAGPLGLPQRNVQLGQLEQDPGAPATVADERSPQRQRPLLQAARLAKASRVGGQVAQLAQRLCRPQIVAHLTELQQALLQPSARRPSVLQVTLRAREVTQGVGDGA